MHKHEKKYEKHTASKTEVGSVARRQLAWKPELEKAEPPLTGKTLSSSFADWAAPRFFAPSFGARFPVCTAFAAHPAQGLFNMELPQHFKAILLAEPASAYMSSRMHVLQALAQEVVPCY